MTKTANTKILIVEDDIIIADYIFEMLEEENFKRLEIANNEETALRKMKEFMPDLILMDINLNGINSGITLSKSKNENAIVIFITGQYDATLMNEALNSNPDAYLTKPIKKIDVLASINLALQKKQKNNYTLSNGNEYIKFNKESLRSLKSEGNYIRVYLENETYLIRNTLDNCLQEIDAKEVIRVHRSYVVNTKFIKHFKANLIYLDRAEIPVSRPYKTTLKELLKERKI